MEVGVGSIWVMFEYGGKLEEGGSSIVVDQILCAVDRREEMELYVSPGELVTLLACDICLALAAARRWWKQSM